MSSSLSSELDDEPDELESDEEPMAPRQGWDGWNVNVPISHIKVRTINRMCLGCSMDSHRKLKICWRVSGTHCFATCPLEPYTQSHLPIGEEPLSIEQDYIIYIILQYNIIYIYIFTLWYYIYTSLQYIIIYIYIYLLFYSMILYIYIILQYTIIYYIILQYNIIYIHYITVWYIYIYIIIIIIIIIIYIYICFIWFIFVFLNVSHVYIILYFVHTYAYIYIYMCIYNAHMDQMIRSNWQAS